MSRFFFLAVGILSFLASFFIAKFFIQFIVLSVFCMVLFMLGESRHEISSLKKTIESHNELLRKAIDEESSHTGLN